MRKKKAIVTEWHNVCGCRGTVYGNTQLGRYVTKFCKRHRPKGWKPVIKGKFKPITV